MAKRGDICWVDLREPTGSEPGYRRPMLIVSADSFNESGLRTVIAAVITSNIPPAGTPGMVALPIDESGLARDSVINLTQLATISKGDATDWTGTTLSTEVMRQVDEGLIVNRLSRTPVRTCPSRNSPLRRFHPLTE